MAASARSRRACPASLLLRASNRRPDASKSSRSGVVIANLIPFATLNQTAAASGQRQIESRIRGGGIKCLQNDEWLKWGELAALPPEFTIRRRTGDKRRLHCTRFND